MPYNREEWLDGWESHGGVSEEALAKAKAGGETHGRMYCPYSNSLQLPKHMALDHVIPLRYIDGLLGGYSGPLRHAGNGLIQPRKHWIAHAECNLLLVSALLNEEKGDRGPDQWMPPNLNFHRPYALIWRYAAYYLGIQHLIPEVDWLALDPLLPRKLRIANG